MAKPVKNLPAVQKTWVWSLGWEDSLEEGIAIHSSILAWKILMDRGVWWAIVHGVAKTQTQLNTVQLQVIILRVLLVLDLIAIEHYVFPVSSRCNLLIYVYFTQILIENKNVLIWWNYKFYNLFHEQQWRTYMHGEKPWDILSLHINRDAVIKYQLMIKITFILILSKFSFCTTIGKWSILSRSLIMWDLYKC